MKFVITRGPTDHYSFRLQSPEGEVLLDSNNYFCESSCRDAIAILPQVVTDHNRFRKNIANNDQYFYALITTQGETLAKSRVYTTMEDREQAVIRVQTALRSDLPEISLN